MQKYRISVIIPCLNSGLTISRAVNSVLTQTYPVHEIIIVDNGSSDDTLEIVRSLEGPIRIFSCPQRGSGPARNLGVTQSTGTLLAFLDSDDFWYPEKIASQVEVIPENNQSKYIIGCYSDYAVEDQIFGHGNESKDDLEAKKDFLLYGKNPSLLSSWLLPKSHFLNNGGFDPVFLIAQDFEFLYRYVKSDCQIFIVRERLLRYNFSTNSATYRSYVAQFLTAKYVLATYGQGKVGDLYSFMIRNGSVYSKLRRKAESGKFVRKAIISRVNFRWHLAVAYLLIALLLDPFSTTQKMRAQFRWLS